jgi:hypothetical protein
VVLLAVAGPSIMVVIAIVRLLRAFRRAVAFPSLRPKPARFLTVCLGRLVLVPPI